MKHTRWTAALLALALVLSLPFTAAAETFSTEDFSLEIPEGMYTFTPSTPVDDPSWALAGVADAQGKLEEYRDMGGVVEMVSEDGETSILLTQSTTEDSESIFNLEDLTEEEQAEFLDGLAQTKTDEIQLEKSYVEINGRLFYRIRFEGVYQEMGYNELLYGTIINGYSLNLDTYGNLDPVSQETEDLMVSIAETITFPEILEKPEITPQDTTQALVTVGLLVVLILVFLAPLIYFPIRNKRDKKQKALLTERLTEYHKTHGNNETITGELLFANSTECTKEAIHTFSIYQAYVKNLPALLVGSVLCLFMLGMAFLLDTEWWLKLLALGITIYYGYKIGTAGQATEKVQRKVFGRGVSDVARLAFYDEAFRVSGIQSASVFPYFQITAVRRHSHYLYLYYGPENAYLVDQYGFTLGEYEEFAAFIREKTGKKF